MAKANTRLENQILHFMKQKKWDKVEGLWPQLAETPSESPKLYAAVSKGMVKREKEEDLKSWVMMVAEACQASGNHKAMIQLARGSLSVIPVFEAIRDPLINALKAHYAKNARTEEYIDVSELGRAESLYKPLNSFLQYIKCSEGEVFQHVEWGEGLVTKMDLEAGRVTIEFREMGAKSFSFAGVREFLKKVSKSHLFAQRLLRPERLVQRAKDSPVEFMKFCLKCLGGSASRAELKDNLLSGVFDQRQWNNWWTRNRDAFRFEPYIGFTGTAANVRLELRREPKSFYEEMLSDLKAVEVFGKLVSLVQDVLKLQTSEPVPEELAVQFMEEIEKRFRACDKKDEARYLEYLYLLEDVKAGLKVPCVSLDDVSSDKVLAATKSPVDLVCALGLSDTQLRAAKRLKELRGDSWNDLAEEMVLSTPMRLSQWVLRDLIEANLIDAASHVAEQLMHRPYENPEMFLWLSRARRAGKFSELQVDVSDDLMFGVVMEVIEDGHKRVSLDDPDATSLRTMVSRFQNFLMDDHFSLVSHVFEDLDQEQAREKYRELMNSNALSEGFKVALDQVLRAIHRDLDGSDDGDASHQGEHLVTAESFHARQTEYMFIKNEEIPINSKAIGTAAAMGDLSENAEYDAAKERQKILFRRLESLEDLLQRARVLEPEQVVTESIGFGTRFEIKNMDAGDIEEYTLLGLWDAQPEKNILSYVTPFGRQFLKRKKGDIIVVVRPGGGSTQYKVLDIHNALLEMAQAK